MKNLTKIHTISQKLVIFTLWLFYNHQKFIEEEILIITKDGDVADEAEYRVANAA